MLGFVQDVILLIAQLMLMYSLVKTAGVEEFELEHAIAWSVEAFFDGVIFLVLVFYAPVVFAALSLMFNIIGFVAFEAIQQESK